MIQKEQKKLLDIFYKIAEGPEIVLPTELFGSKFSGIELTHDEYNFFLPVFSMSYKEAYTLGDREYSVDGTMRPQTLITGEKAYVHITDREDAIRRMRTIIDLLIVLNTKYSDLLQIVKEEP